ncbi:hypothetical protein B5M09_005005, partial [Aphanomyces astaci]
MEHKDPLAVRFVAGAVASTTAELCTLPMDCSKVRMQTHGLRTSTTVQFNSGLLDTIRKVVRYEGPWSLWNGAKPAVVRQVVFYSASMVLYTPLRDSSVWPGEATYVKKIVAGGISGAIGVALANPYETNWNVAQHPARFRCKRCRVRKQSLIAVGLVTEGTVGATMGASLVAGFAGAVVSSPLDVIKTRLMAHQNNRHYTGVLDCGRELYQMHGVRAFYKGFAAYYLREAPWCCLFFVTYELVRNSILRPH